MTYYVLSGTLSLYTTTTTTVVLERSLFFKPLYVLLVLPLLIAVNRPSTPISCHQDVSSHVCTALSVTGVLWV